MSQNEEHRRARDFSKLAVFWRVHMIMGSTAINWEKVANWQPLRKRLLKGDLG
jgi:hypothetical protein